MVPMKVKVMRVLVRIFSSMSEFSHKLDIIIPESDIHTIIFISHIPLSIFSGQIERIEEY